MNARQRQITMLLTLAASVNANTLRGNGNTLDTNDRNLYGFEFGMEGYEKIMQNPDFGEGLLEKEKAMGPEVLFEPVNTPPPPPGLEARIVGGDISRIQPGFVMHLDWDFSRRSWHFGGCGGSLITPCHVLTAGHCVDGDRAGKPHGVYVSAYQPFAGNPGVPFFFATPKNIIVHPDFDDPLNLNDIAIIEMSTCIDEADIDTFVPMTIPTPDQSFPDGTLATVMGFGAMSYQDPTLTPTLLEVDVPIMDDTTCKESYSVDRIQPDMFCAGYPEGKRDSCSGDSGGPLVVDPDSKSPTQVGIVSWGYKCAEAGKPGVYASTTYHFDFIIKNTCNHDESERFELCKVELIAEEIAEAPSAAPSMVPSLAPSMVPSEIPTEMPVQRSSVDAGGNKQCSAVGKYCLGSDDCCGNMRCLTRDNECYVPNTRERKRHGDKGRTTTTRAGTR